MRTCVIGGGGFIGKYLVKLLLASGRDVLVLGRRSERPLDLSTNAYYKPCDYADKNNLRKCLVDCDEIVDLAYATVPQTSFENPIFDLQANLPPSVALLEVANELNNLRCLIVTSSGGTVYGLSQVLPITEECATQPISPYGITKLAIERYALMFHLLSDLPVIIVRPSNAFGLGQKPFTGQGFIATAMGKVLKNEPVTIFGENGTIRDYVHVKDIALGILCAMDRGEAGEIYNIGSGIGRSNRDVLEEMRPIVEGSGFSIRSNNAQPRGFDVPTNVLSYEKLLKHANWQPEVSFDTGICEMWEGMLSNFKS
ncbi:NAD-dependent epimerase/dehydratase family protein [Thalassospira profundimaris]|uniref:NAD-dependent epimerase/dehydratase family protein n=1 Tax=Thalassospira profundimaris TaxID=502049 RepID=UPI0002872239|nr:NAD-dependent epimerase/dehydratase family protein [Thalassospira profundimaris]EKF09235.1 NAD-dependent epimerase/dehydratase [Thalassospira profundimaris WP0211]